MIQFFSKTEGTNQPLAGLLINSKVKELTALYKSRCCDCHPNFQWTVGIELTKGTYVISDVIAAEIQPCPFLKDILTNEIIPRLNPVTV